MLEKDGRQRDRKLKWAWLWPGFDSTDVDALHVSCTQDKTWGWSRHKQAEPILSQRTYSLACNKESSPGYWTQVGSGKVGLCDQERES